MSGNIYSTPRLPFPQSLSRLRRRRFAYLSIAGATLLAACAPSADQHAERGTFYLQEAQYQAAILEFRNAIQLEPMRADVRLKLGDAYLHTNDGPNALREYVRAADLSPDDHDAQIKAGKLLLLSGAFEDAHTRAERVLREAPRNVSAQILRGNALVGLRDVEGAIAQYEEAAALEGPSERALLNIGTVQRSLGRTHEAEAAFRSAIAEAPDSISARLALGNLYWATGRVPEAEQAFKDALVLDKSNFVVHRALGVLYATSGRQEDAEAHFRVIATGGDEAAKLTLAHYYAGVNRSDEARSLLDELSRKPSSKASATVRLAAIDAMEGRRAEGLYRLRLLLDEQPSNATALIMTANLLRLEGRREEALTTVQRVLTIDGTSPSAYLLAGRLYAEQDRTDEAIAAYERVLQLDARPVAALIELTRLHLRLGSGNALSFAQQAVALQPRSIEARSLLIRSELQEGDVARALLHLEAFARAFPESATMHALTASVERARNQNHAARAAYDRALAIAPRHVEALDGMTALDIADGRVREATTRLDAILASGTATPDLLMVAARGYAAAGKAPASERALSAAIEIDPARLEAYELLGRIKASQGRLGEATEQFQTIVIKHPDSVSGRTMLGMLLEMQGRVADAETEYKHALAVNPRAPIAANNLAYIYVSSNRDLDEALVLAQVAQQQLPFEPNVSDTLGWIYVQKNMSSRAIPHLEASAAGMPDHPDVLLHLGTAYYQSGDWVKARQALERALLINPKMVGADEARKMLAVVGQ